VLERCATDECGEGGGGEEVLEKIKNDVSERGRMEREGENRHTSV
jgi:hypothetical protein